MKIQAVMQIDIDKLTDDEPIELNTWIVTQLRFF